MAVKKGDHPYRVRKPKRAPSPPPPRKRSPLVQAAPVRRRKPRKTWYGKMGLVFLGVLAGVLIYVGYNALPWPISAKDRAALRTLAKTVSVETGRSTEAVWARWRKEMGVAKIKELRKSDYGKARDLLMRQMAKKTGRPRAKPPSGKKPPVLGGGTPNDL